MAISDKEWLRMLLQKKALRAGKFTFTSGLKSNFYLDCRVVTLSAEGAWLIGRMLFNLVAGLNVNAIGGPTLGADPIVTAVLFQSYPKGNPMNGFLVRNEPKKHGTQRLIEGNLPADCRVVLVDDVISTGGSLLGAIEAVEAKGCTVVAIITLADWQKGGSKLLISKGYNFISLYEISPEGIVKIV